MSFLAVPYHFALGDPVKNVYILDRFVEHPDFVSQESTPEERRMLCASILSDPRNLIYEVWDGRNLAGVISLQDVVPRNDALLHFLWLDGKLLGKRKFLWAFIGHCFRYHELRRVTVKVPEFQTTLTDWFRRKLHFRYEGEPTACVDAEVQARYAAGDPGVAIRAARLGSRIEKAHWHEGEWHDVLRLRLFREEFDAIGG
jgi:hypothetical protein